MAFETDTATDYLDLLNKLKLFMTGANSPSSGLEWVVLKEDSTFVGSQIPDGEGAIDDASNNDQDHSQIIFRGTGGVSPEQNIYFEIQTMGLAIAGAFNWQMRGLTGFIDSSPETVFLDQPGVSPPAYLLLQNTTMTYWFVGNDRHVKGTVKTGTAYHTFYLGFLNTFSTVTEYPYPLVVSGTGGVEDNVFSQNSVHVSSAVLHGGGNSSVVLASGDPFPINESSGWVRFTDGNWYGIKNQRTSAAREARLTQGIGIAHSWPLGQVIQSLVAPENLIDQGDNFATVHTSTTPGDDAPAVMVPSPGSPALTTLWPLTVHLLDSMNILGEFDGLYWLTSQGGITSEDTITDTGESPEVIHTIFQNVWRTDAWMFLALRHEA